MVDLLSTTEREEAYIYGDTDVLSNSVRLQIGRRDSALDCSYDVGLTGAAAACTATLSRVETQAFCDRLCPLEVTVQAGGLTAAQACNLASVIVAAICTGIIYVSVDTFFTNLRRAVEQGECFQMFAFIEKPIVGPLRILPPGPVATTVSGGAACAGISG